MNRLRLSIMAALLLMLALALPVAASHTEDLDCLDDFDSQAAAQEHYRNHPTDPDGLDGNEDGIACESYIGDYDDPATDLRPVTDGTDPEPTPTPAPATGQTQQGKMPSVPSSTGGGALSAGGGVPVGLPLAIGWLAVAGAAILRRR